MAFDPARGVRVRIVGAVLDAICDECDRFDDVETGGRLIGTIDVGRTVEISVTGMIDPGPKAKRARTSFFQDGEYQERIFRAVEKSHPAVEHLGTWHTHHVNGYPELSGGDVSTYQRTVNHPHHNLDFWYALLVTRKVGGAARYACRHYILRRGDKTVYEINPRRIEVSRRPPVWVPDRSSMREHEPLDTNQQPSNNRIQRASDDSILRTLYPNLRPFVSAKSGALSWKGTIELADASECAVVVAEQIEHGDLKTYQARLLSAVEPNDLLVNSNIGRNPWMAVRKLESLLNRAIVANLERDNKL